MKKDLLEALLDKPQREIAGSDSASRFDYQKNWAFCEMLRRHMADADYLVAFEFHDDVVFLSLTIRTQPISMLRTWRNSSRACSKGSTKVSVCLHLLKRQRVCCSVSYRHP